MSHFIELTRSKDGGPVTVAIEHMVAVYRKREGERVVGTGITLSTGFGNFEVTIHGMVGA